MDEETSIKNFIEVAIEEDLASGRFDRVQTRFPPEPNGYLHIGHAKAITIDFGMAEKYKGVCNLRFDDTNPTREDVEYVESIKEDILWLGYRWGNIYFASDYFEQIYQFAVTLIKDGKAYVDHLTSDEIREYRGTLTEPGKNSPYRDLSVEENLALFEQMRSGVLPDGACVLRAKIDMASPNMNMRDPVLYRILHDEHHRTGNDWCIYPMYDFAHGQSDSIEGVTHSLCSLEFENHRPLYDWFINELDIYKTRQIEFARLNLTYTVMSKRKLLRLVQEGHVTGWDDPRMPTLSGMRRRGYTSAAIRSFLDLIGVAKTNSIIDVQMLEFAVRQDLNAHAQRVMGVLDPVKLVIDNYPDDLVEEMEAINNPEEPEHGTRVVPFSKVLYIEREDFMEEPAPKFYRLSPGKEVRLRYAYFVTCTHVVKDADGRIAEIHCTYDPATRGGDAPDGRKVKATLHWVSAPHAVESEVRLYNSLFTVPNPGEGEKDFLDEINPDSMQVLPNCLVEPFVKTALPGDRFQFERKGYFCVDPDNEKNEKPVFNLTVSLKDSYRG